MSQHSRNALHAIRMVIGYNRAPIRSYTYSASLAAEPLFHFPSISQSQTLPHDSLHPPIDFLEDEAEAYDTARAALMPRASARPIPWPTLLQRKERTTRPLVCDPLHQLVQQKDYAAARLVLQELLDAGITPHARSTYLDAALSCLYAKKPDKEGFLLWLKYYPNRPARTPHGGSKGIFRPILNHLRAYHTRDIDFLREFTVLASRLGLLPVVYNAMFTHFAVACSPAVSLQIHQQAIDAYRAATTSRTSTSERARQHADFVDKQVEMWWEMYLQRLVAMGYKEEAKALFETLDISDAGVNWSQSNRNLIDHPEAMAVRELERDISSWSSIRKTTPTILTEEHSRNDLAQLIEQTQRQADARPNLYPKLRAKYKQVGQEKGYTVSTEEKWVAAQIIAYRRQGRHVEAIRLYMSRFMWYGLPDHPVQARVAPQNVNFSNLPRPNVHDVTRILPSLLATFGSGPKGDSSLGSTGQMTLWYERYLNQSATLPIFMRPTDVTHGIFVRTLIHKRGAYHGERGIDMIAKSGNDPGEKAYASLLLSFARSKKLDRMKELLEAMEAQRERNGFKLPKPTAATYEALRVILSQNVLDTKRSERERLVTKPEGRRQEAGDTSGTARGAGDIQQRSIDATL